MARVSGYDDQPDPSLYWAGAHLYDPRNPLWGMGLRNYGVILKNGKAYVYDADHVNLGLQARIHHAPEGVISANANFGNGLPPVQTQPQTQQQTEEPAINRFGSKNQADLGAQ